MRVTFKDYISSFRYCGGKEAVMEGNAKVKKNERAEDLQHYAKDAAIKMMKLLK
jgi:predicted transcriptional regulator of viral defense system